MLLKRTVYSAYLIALCLNSVNAIYEPTNHLASRNKNPAQTGNVKTFSWQQPSNNDPVDVEIHHNYSKVSHHSTVNPNYSPGNGMFPILTTTPVPLARKPRNYYHEAAPQQIKRERYQQLLVAPRDTCPAGHTGRLPVTESCNMFLNCYKGRGYTQPCAAGTLFNAHTLECDHAYKVACIADEMKRHVRRMSADNRDMRTLERSMQQECVKGFVGVMPNYWDCTKYIMCQDNSRKLMMDCDRGMLFDIRTNRCRFQREAYCFNVGDLQDSKTQFPSQTNNGGYEQRPIQKQNGVQYGGYQQGNCPPGNVGGLLPHPVHCQMYLQCNHGQLIERSCGIGTVFNPSLGVCDHPGNVNCHKSNQQNEQTNDGGYNDDSRVHGGYTNQFKGNARDTYGNSHQNQPSTPFNRSSVEYNTKTHQFDSEYHDNFGANLRPTTSDFSDYQNGGQNTNLNYLTTTTTPPPIDLDEGGGYGYYLVRPARMPPQPPSRGSSLGTPQWPPPFPDVVNTDYDYVIDYEELPLDATWHTKHNVSTTTARPSGVRYNNRPNDGRVCREGLTFECQANDCIDISLVCDTKKDCGNGKDEFNCAESIAQFTQTKSAKLAIKEYTKYRTITKTYCAKLCYEALDFVCKSFNYRQIDDSCFLLKANVAETGLLIKMPTYIYYEHIAHMMDCTDLYMCKNNKCIDRSQVCDGVDDCLDRQDERNCAADVLGYTLNLETPHGFRTNEGNLVVTAFGRSGYICDDGFSLTSAHVACKELGYGAGALQVHPRTYYPIRSQSFGYGYANTNGSDTFYMMDDVVCAGDETQLKDCYFAGWGVNDCEGNEVLGVVCQNNDDSTKTTAKNNAGHKQEEANETAHYVCTSNEWLCQTQAECLPLQYMCDGIYDCADHSDEWERLCTSPLEIRLSNNPDAGKGTNQKMAGRLEVRRHGTWGTVCDDRFKDGEATVACRQIFGGRIGGVVGKVLRDASYGPGLGPIWLDQVTCAGNESNLTDCAHAPWNRHNCDHNEDVAIQCTLQQSPTRPTNVNRKYPQHYGGVKTLSSGVFRRFTKEDLDLYNYPGKCGVKADDLLKSGATFRVLNAPSAPPGSVPWQATISLRSHNVLRPVHWCGGVILSPLHVLTAAHCLDGVTKSNIRISAGDYDRDIDEGTEQIARIEDFIQHEEFRHGSRKNNDIAVIKLSDPGFNMTDDVKAICLPERDAEYRDGADCEVSGFGVTQHSVRKASRQLKAASIPIQTRAVCKMPHIYGNELMEGMFCAGSLEGGIDACDGDSGGPLACIHEGYYTLFGITSWGHKCGEANKPGVYVKVAYYRGWIQDAIAKLSLD